MEGYEVDEALEEATKLYEENKNIKFKCKGCILGGMNLMKTKKHFKICEYRIDNLVYRE